MTVRRSGQRAPRLPCYARTMRFTASIQREGDGYVAQAIEIDVASQGATIEEAVANLREAIELYLDESPLPARVEPAFVTTIDVALPAAS